MKSFFGIITAIGFLLLVFMGDPHGANVDFKTFGWACVIWFLCFLACIWFD